MWRSRGRFPSRTVVRYHSRLFRIQSKRSFGLTVALLATVALVAAVVAAATGRMIGGEGPERLPQQWQRGVNLTAFLPDAYAGAAAERAMLTARAAGARLVALTPTAYMDTANSSEIAADPEKTPTDASLLAAARLARGLGLAVAIKPHVDVRDGTFRGEVAPADRERWFASYGELVDRYAELAERAGAAQFVIGTELTSMSGEGDAWRELIARARKRFDGRILYAANWVDGAEQVSFWNALDAIGIDAYMPLGDDPDPTIAELVERWQPYLERIEALHRRWRLPVLFTELGYESRPGTAARIEAGSTALSERAQADAYEATFEALSPLPFFHGVWWWEWSAEGLGIGPGDGGFSPEGKDAAEVLERWQR